MVQMGEQSSMRSFQFIFGRSGIFAIAVIIAKFSIFSMDDALCAFINADLARAINCLRFCPGVAGRPLCMRLFDIPAAIRILNYMSLISGHVVIIESQNI